MRSSRRNLGLNPELTPEPTPPSLSDDDFIENVQIETTLEEEERYRMEEERLNQHSEEHEDKSEQATDVVLNNPIPKDIVFSSDVSMSDDSSEESVKVVEKAKSESKSSENQR